MPEIVSLKMRSELEIKMAQGRVPGQASWFRTDAEQAEALHRRLQTANALIEAAKNWDAFDRMAEDKECAKLLEAYLNAT